MEYAVVTVPAAPVRRKPNHRKEMVNQLLFGESVKILASKGELWRKVRSLHDQYEGWMTSTQILPVEENIATAVTEYCSAGLFSEIEYNGKLFNIPFASSLPFFDPLNKKGLLAGLPYQLKGDFRKREQSVNTRDILKRSSHLFINSPYLWGGRTVFGIDCSGFVQVIHKLAGVDLPRDAWQQAQEGKGIKKFKEAMPGDLLFFNNKEDIVHVGILLEENKVIHASGKVRIDSVDKKGIINDETGKRGLKLSTIRRIS